METMHAAGRRRLPPVPRPAGSRPAGGQLTVERPAPGSIDAEHSETQVIDTRQIAAEEIEAELAALTAGAAATDAADLAEETVAPDDTDRFQAVDVATEIAIADDPGAETETADAEEEDAPEAADDPTEHPAEAPVDDRDPAQQFVARLRSSAVDFAAAAGAESAVVREAVPPARHRRARCRLVLRYGGGDVADVTLLGPAGAPGRPSRHGFDRQILRWLSAGLVRHDDWLVDDPDAPDGVAVDLSAWVAAG